MIRYSSLFFVLSFVGVLHAAEEKMGLADYLTYRVTRIVSLHVFEGLSQVIESNKNLTGYSSTTLDDFGRQWGGKTALHELLLKFANIKEDDREFSNMRHALICKLLKQLTPEQAHELIHAQTKTNKATPQEIIAFYGSNEQAQYHYVAGEREKLLALLEHYDQSASATADDAAMNDA